MEYGDAYLEISYLLNGPLILATFCIGNILNSITIFVLEISRKRGNWMRPPCTSNTATDTPINRGSKNANSTSKTKLPRIYVYSLWLTVCDMLLLTFTMLNYSIPTILDCFAMFYARLIPIW